MNKKYFISILFFLVIIAASVVAYLNMNKDNENLTDEEIKVKYCHVTADVRKTDVYCQNSELYRQHVRDESVIQE